MIIAVLFSFLLGSSHAYSSPMACDVPGVNEIEITDIKRLLSAPCNFKADQLVNALPQEMRDYVVIMKKSASLVANCITPEAPRMIYSGPKVIVAIPWNATTVPECGLAEVIGTLQTPGLHPTIVDFSHTENQIDSSGSRCVRCHKEGFIPSWPTYADWVTPRNAPFAGVDDNIKVGDLEFQELKNLVQIARKENKMSWLGSRMQVFESKITEIETAVVDVDNEHGILLLDQNLPYAFVTEEFQKGDYGRYGKKHPNYATRPNFRLGMIINNMNAVRVSQIILNKLPRTEVLSFLKSLDFCVAFTEASHAFEKFVILLKRVGLSDKDLILSPTIPAQYKVYDDGNSTTMDVLANELLRKLDLMPPEGQMTNYSAYYQRSSLFGGPRPTYDHLNNCKPIKDKLDRL